MKKDIKDLLIGIVLFLLSTLFLLTMHHFVSGGIKTEVGSLIFPQFTIASISLLSLILAIFGYLRTTEKFSSRFKSGEDELHRGTTNAVEKMNRNRIILYVFLLFGYFLMLYFLGFLISTPVILFLAMVLLRGQNLKVMISLSIVTALVIYYSAYYFMRVMLPAGIFFE
jgi:hypothetical protein